jgi:hypothetical protein
MLSFSDLIPKFSRYNFTNVISKVLGYVGSPEIKWCQGQENPVIFTSDIEHFEILK